MQSHENRVSKTVEAKHIKVSLAGGCIVAATMLVLLPIPWRALKGYGTLVRFWFLLEWNLRNVSSLPAGAVFSNYSEAVSEVKRR